MRTTWTTIHGDGIVALARKVEWGEHEALVATDPARFHRPAYIGSKGWVGVRLDTGEVDWAAVADLVAESSL